MFKNRSLQVKVVNDSKTAESKPQSSLWTPEVVTNILNEQTKRVAIGLVVAYAAVKTINTASEIAVNMTPKR